MKRSLLAVLTAAVLSSIAPAQCVRNTPGPFGLDLQLDGVDGPAYTTITWDQDGAGPQPPVLVVGGAFLNAGTLPVNGVATFDGAWHNLGSGFDLPSLPQSDIGVHALAVYDPDGNGSAPARLYAAASLLHRRAAYDPSKTTCRPCRATARAWH